MADNRSPLFGRSATGSFHPLAICLALICLGLALPSARAQTIMDLETQVRAIGTAEGAPSDEDSPKLSATSTRRRPARPQAHWAVSPLSGYDPTVPGNEDLQVLRPLIGDASVAAFGESYHTSAGFYLMKHRVLRFLVEEMGFRAFAIESLWQGAEAANAYVQTCQGTAQQAIRDHINVWQSTEYADMVQWMCEWNRTHSAPEEKLTLFGFDIQQPWYDGPELIRFLEQIGIPRSDPRSSGINLCEAVVDRHPFGQIPPERHQTCVQALDAIEEHLRSNRSSIENRTSPAAVEIALLRTIGLRAWEDSAFIIAHDFARGYNARDEGMAYAFHVLRSMKAPGAKTMVWAANSHVARNPLPGGEVPFGSYLSSTLGADYVSFALTAYDTEIDFPGLGCGLVDRRAGSVEEQLATYEHDALVAHPRGGSGRDAIFPMGIDHVRPYADYDGIIFLRHSPRMHPLAWGPCR